MDVPDLYHFLAQEISKPSNYGPEILTVHGVSDNDKDEGDKNDRQVHQMINYDYNLCFYAF